MKETGIEWVGKIPAQWNVLRIKNIVVEGKDGIKIGPFGSALTNRTVEHGDYNVYSQANLISGNYETTKHTVDKETFEELTSYEVFPGDVCLSMMGTIGKCKTVPENIKKGIMDSHLIKIRLSDKVYTRYFEYQYDKDLGAVCFDQMQFDKKGFIMDGLNTSIVKNLYFVLPPLEKQIEISKYLDRKCKDIDNVIEKSEIKIHEYINLKKNIISSAVTEGITSCQSIKNSGVDWIGNIPQDWKLVKLKGITSLVTDGTHVTPEYLDAGIPFISIKDISSGKIDFSDTKFISEEQHLALSKSTPVEKGDMLFTRIGTLGVFLIVDTDKVFDIFVSVGLIKFNQDIDLTTKRFIQYYFSSIQHWNYINLVKAGGGTAAAKFNLGDARNSIIPMPTKKSEMEDIIYYLDKRCSEIDAMIEKQNNFILELKKYKKSLIFECVTGKRKVV